MATPGGCRRAQYSATPARFRLWANVHRLVVSEPGGPAGCREGLHPCMWRPRRPLTSGFKSTPTRTAGQTPLATVGT